eukprot:Selendium_serpulae@DN6177_c3_g1_i4.p2
MGALAVDPERDPWRDVEDSRAAGGAHHALVKEADICEALSLCCKVIKRLMLENGSLLADFHVLPDAAPRGRQTDDGAASVSTPSAAVHCGAASGATARPSLPPFWRIPLVNPDMSEANMKAIITTLAQLGDAAFPLGSFSLAPTTGEQGQRWTVRLNTQF